MANTIEYGKIFQQELDKKFVPGAVTGWMDANTKQAKYAGGNEIKIPVMSVQGLGDYDRAGGTGAPEGDVTISYQTMVMTQDRARGFTIDEMDVDESNFVAVMGTIMGEFQRTQVIPEVDAYRLSKLYALADTRKRTYTPAKASVLEALLADIVAVRDKVGHNAPLVCHISSEAWAILNTDTTLSRMLNIADFARGELTTKVKVIDEVPLLPTQNALMKTAFVFNDAKTEGQEAGGFVAGVGAKAINWLIVAKNAPLAPCKVDNVRTFTPQTWQKARAWHSDYRRYHDLWVPQNRLDGIFANIGA